MRCLIFGGHGFVGRNLREQLPYDFVAPTRQDLDIEKEFHFSADIDVVINLVNAKDNLQAYQNITHYYRGKLIHLGSGAEYDKSKPIKSVIEEDVWDREPKDKYGMEKKYISNHIEFRPNTVCLRPFGVFGKYEDYKRRFISKAILDNMKGDTIEIRQNVKFSYVWVNDLIRIIDYFINNDAKHKFYNVGGHQLKLNQIARKIGKYKVRKWWGKEYTCNDNRVRHETGIIYTPFDYSLNKLKKFYESPLHS